MKEFLLKVCQDDRIIKTKGEEIKRTGDFDYIDLVEFLLKLGSSIAEKDAEGQGLFRNS